MRAKIPSVMGEMVKALPFAGAASPARDRGTDSGAENSSRDARMCENLT